MRSDCAIFCTLAPGRRPRTGITMAVSNASGSRVIAGVVQIEVDDAIRLAAGSDGRGACAGRRARPSPLRRGWAAGGHPIPPRGSPADCREHAHESVPAGIQADDLARSQRVRTKVPLTCTRSIKPSSASTPHRLAHRDARATPYSSDSCSRVGKAARAGRPASLLDLGAQQVWTAPHTGAARRCADGGGSLRPCFQLAPSRHAALHLTLHRKRGPALPHGFSLNPIRGKGKARPPRGAARSLSCLFFGASAGRERRQRAYEIILSAG